MTVPQKIVIATHNHSKFEEIKNAIDIYAPHPITVLSLTDLSIQTAPEENGKTFEDNARIKACYYAQLTLLPVIADDGGLIIDALNGEPGVKSNRWLGKNASGNELINHALTRLSGVSSDKRTARFQVSLVYFDPQSNKEMVETESIEGRIAQHPLKTTKYQGYPYRKIFVVDGLNKYYDVLSEDEHKAINHRYRALRKLLDKI